MDTNHGYLVSEATALPTEPQPQVLLNRTFFAWWSALPRPIKPKMASPQHKS